MQKSLIKKSTLSEKDHAFWFFNFELSQRNFLDMTIFQLICNTVKTNKVFSLEQCYFEDLMQKLPFADVLQKKSTYVNYANFSRTLFFYNTSRRQLLLMTSYTSRCRFGCRLLLHQLLLYHI